MKIHIENILSSIPTDDGNFRAALSNASVVEINSTITLLKTRAKNKTRIAICERELKKRKKARMM